ncbi:MAG: hypothetical protein ACREMY_01385 [bacterium]
MPTADEVRKRPRRAVAARASEQAEPEIPFGTKNYVIFGAAALVILAGYLALSRGSITLAPILLLVGYLILVPWGILAR